MGVIVVLERKGLKKTVQTFPTAVVAEPNSDGVLVVKGDVPGVPTKVNTMAVYAPGAWIAAYVDGMLGSEED